jgi:hypothetical protein
MLPLKFHITKFLSNNIAIFVIYFDLTLLRHFSILPRTVAQ